MAIQRWNPFIDVRPFNRARFGAFESGRWPIPVDVVSEGEDVIVRASLPGLKPEDISVTLEDRLLTIQGETATDGEFEKADYLLRERRVGTLQPIPAPAQLPRLRKGRADLRERGSSPSASPGTSPTRPAAWK